MKGAKVILRLCVSSECDNKDKFIEAIRSLPDTYDTIRMKGERAVLTSGKLSAVTSKQSYVEYKKEYLDVKDVENCNRCFLQSWRKHLPTLETIGQKEFINISLDYEITIYDSSFPSFYFYPEVIRFLNDINATLTFYYYSD